MEQSEAKYGRQDPRTLTCVANLGVNFRDAGRYTEAITLLEEVSATSSAHPSLHFVKIELADAYLRAEQAEPLLRECLALHETNASDNWRRYHVTAMLGQLLVRQNEADTAGADVEKLKRAESLLLAGLTGMQEREATKSSQNREQLSGIMRSLIKVYTKLGRPADSDAWQVKFDTLLKS